MQQDLTNEITRVRWQRAFELCETCATLPLAERARYLQTACGGDSELLRCAQQMLSAQTEAETTGFLETPAWSYTPPPTDAHAALGQAAGAYRITQFLDRGGMGEVYLAKRADGMFDRKVAVKLMRANLNAKEYRRFRREVQILADLKHDNLVTLYDAGRLSDGRPYLVMEYVEGENLRAWLQTQTTPARETLSEIIRQACAGLHAAHQSGVIHRDIKPGNIIVQQHANQCSVKLLDFGIAHRHEPFQTNQTQTDGAIGTVGYMSPEQLHGTPPEQLTAASDVYSIGLVCYEMLAGQQAYAGNSQAEIIAKRFYQPLPPPSARRPELGFSAALDRVVMKALANVPQDRYQTTLAFARELTEALRETAPLTDPYPVSPVPEPAPTAELEPAHRQWMWLAALVLALGIGGCLFWLRNSIAPASGQAEPQAAAPALPVAPSATPMNPPAAALPVWVTVWDKQKQPLPGSRFRLFQAGLSSLPEVSSADNTLCDKTTDAVGETTCGELRVAEGRYLISVTHPGYRTYTEVVRLEKNRLRPDVVWLRFTLGRE